MFKSLKKFDTISLTEMDAKMWSIGLDRMEKKYILHISMLDKFLKELQDDYVALEIQWIREFSYHNVYFDTSDYKFFHEHGKWYKLRTKLRTRKYTDSDLAFFEYKQRYYENIRKFKFEIKLGKHWSFTQRMRSFTQKLYESIYQKQLKEEIRPSLSTEYIRFTLCSKKNDERITFDSKVTFTDLRNKKTRPYMLSDIILIESKANKPQHHAEKILSNLWATPLSAISKYCLWLLFEETIKTTYERFEEVIEYINQLQKKQV